MSQSKRRYFSPEFKQEAVRRLRERQAAGVSLAQVGRELGVRPDMLRGWAKQLDGGGGGPAPASIAGTSPSETEELRRLRRELEVVRQERDFLKKAAAFFAKEQP